MKQRLILIVGHIIPIFPLIRCLKDSNRKFYTFIEQPIIGIFVTPISLIFANEITQNPYTINADFLQSCIEIYLAYQAASLVRDGVNTDEKISLRTKVILNWFYSAASYSIFTAGGKIAGAKNSSEISFAYGLVIFSLLWPIFSQIISTYIWTPIMFSKFPKLNLLRKLFDNNISKKELLTIVKSEWDINWVLWYRQKHRIRNRRYQQIEYWLIKTFFACLVAITMTTIYFIARWNLVGIDSSSDSLLTSLGRLFI